MYILQLRLKLAKREVPWLKVANKTSNNKFLINNKKQNDIGLVKQNGHKNFYNDILHQAMKDEE